MEISFSAVSFFDSQAFTFVLLPILIFIARVCDVTLGTIRIIFVSRGQKILAPLVGTGGYGVSKIQVCKNSPVLDKTLIESKLRNVGIIVLAIVRGGETIASPVADTKILLGDELVCFGKLGEIRDKVCKMSEPPDKK